MFVTFESKNDMKEYAVWVSPTVLVGPPLGGFGGDAPRRGPAEGVRGVFRPPVYDPKLQLSDNRREPKRCKHGCVSRE